MSEKKIVVPEGMLEAAMDATIPALGHITNTAMFTVALEAALRWLSENAPQPTPQQWKGLFAAWNDRIKASETLANSPHPIEDQLRFTVIEWQRRMFLTPEPEIPEAIKDLLEWDCDWGSNYLKGYILEAFRRGQKAGPQ